ncbi:hypothetical protein CVT24_004473 [Panaeolus cyanescens]|uniref:Uncharacterized protein n=1 Tax=Panaeolus cyanescens TaxID=181874 RepID=A0A409V9Y9_9AGAR|nr:hypothetical protein CVT24_004473 [Panaeolus cyanescens]
MSKDAKVSESTASLLSYESTATLTSPEKPPMPTVQQPRQKNYEAALGALQSRYGTAGNTPSPKPRGEASNKLTLPLHLQMGSSNSTETASSNQLQPSSYSQNGSCTTEGSGASRNEPKKSLFSNLLKGPKKR